MKIFLLLLLLPTLGVGQILDPLEYMKKISADEQAISRDMWAYMRASARGRNARALDKKRQELIKTYYAAKNRVSQMPSYKKDPSFKAAMAQYYQLNLRVLQEDYAKIIDLEEIAENSYDLMEAYLTAMELVDVKMDSAFSKLSRAQKSFAEKNNIRLVEGEGSRLSQKIRKVGRINGYVNDVFLVFFKVRHQERYLVEAQNKGDIGAMDQASQKLMEFAKEGKAELEEMGPFGGTDYSLIQAVNSLMDFYIMESNTAASIIEFYIVKEDMNKSSKYMNSKKQKDLTQADIDKHNRLVAKYNQAVANFNKQNDQLNTIRSQKRERWYKAQEDFYKTHS